MSYSALRRRLAKIAKMFEMDATPTPTAVIISMPDGLFYLNSIPYPTLEKAVASSGVKNYIVVRAEDHSIPKEQS